MRRISESQQEQFLPLYLVKLSGGMLRGRTRLQKLAFLSQQESKGKIDYDFHKAPFGPLSYDLYSIMENLDEMGLIAEDTDYTDSGNEVVLYRITEEGEKFLDLVSDSGILDKELKSAVDRVFQQYGDMPYVELLDKVHEDFPEYVENVD